MRPNPTLREHIRAQAENRPGVYCIRAELDTMSGALLWAPDRSRVRGRPSMSLVDFSRVAPSNRF